MTAKRALIVDDSKSARVVLSRLLEKHDLTVDMRDSAEGALHYLRDNRPDVIFMDHVMSGMDGLSAVQAIKNDPNTAAIPIMMYTSQDGELYAGEARASGAVGVLPKQMAPSDIAEVLKQLQVLADTRAAAPPVAEPALGAVAGAVLATPPQPGQPAQAVAAAPPSLSAGEMRSIVEPLLQEQGIDLRRFVVASLDGVSARVVSEMSERLQRMAADINGAIAAAKPPPAPEPPLVPRPVGWIALATVALLAAIVLGSLAWQQHGEVATLRARAEATAPAPIAAVPVAHDEAPPGDAAAASSSAPAAAPAPAPVAAATSAAPVAAPAIPAKRLAVPYGEIAFTPARVAALGVWLAGLERRGFAGTVRVVTSAGEYCLTGNPTEGYTPAPAELPANRCDVVGSPPDEAQRAGDQQPQPVAALIAGVRERSQGAIDVSIGRVTRPPGAGYPPASDASAAQWNAVAATRNYLEFSAETRPVTP